MAYFVTFESNIFKQPSSNSLLKWTTSIFNENKIKINEVFNYEWGHILFTKYKNTNYSITLLFETVEEDEEIYDTEEEYIENNTIGIEKERSILEKITFKNKMNERDELLTLIEMKINQIESVENVTTGKIA